MLGLPRKLGEKIAIGNRGEILITIVGIRGKRIQLGVDADPAVPVQRVVSTLETVIQNSLSPKE